MWNKDKTKNTKTKNQYKNKTMQTKDRKSFYGLASRKKKNSGMDINVFYSAPTRTMNAMALFSLYLYFIFTYFVVIFTFLQN